MALFADKSITRTSEFMSHSARQDIGNNVWELPSVGPSSHADIWTLPS